MTVRRLLQGRDTRVLSVTPDTLVLDAIKLMAEQDIGALLVMQGEEAVGIITERDYLTKLILRGKHSDSTPVGEVMTSPVLFVEPAHSVEQCMAIMTEKRVRHLPVRNDGRVIGMISMRDVVADLISEKQFLIEQLKGYIYGQQPAG